MRDGRAFGRAVLQRSFTRILMRKNELWRLPYDRVLYLDADTFLLRDAPARAAPERAYGPGDVLQTAALASLRSDPQPLVP